MRNKDLNQKNQAGGLNKMKKIIFFFLIITKLEAASINDYEIEDN